LGKGGLWVALSVFPRGKVVSLPRKEFFQSCNNYQKAVAGIRKPIIKALQVNFSDSPGVQALKSDTVLSACRAAGFPEALDSTRRGLNKVSGGFYA